MNDHEWCRLFIDRHCVLRAPPDQLLMTSASGGVNTYQFYLPIAVSDQEFARRIGRMFWQLFGDEFRRQPFQLCGCESGGIPLACALQALAYDMGMLVNVFAAKKVPKAYGLGNWLEGVVLPDVPVVLVDDVVGEGKTLAKQAQRLTEFGLKVIGAFAIAACKLAKPVVLENCPEITACFDRDDFVRGYLPYVAKYGRPPEFLGTVV